MKKNYLGHVEIPLKRIHLELTNVCNFNCRFCPKSEMKRPNGFMETRLAKTIISDIASKGLCEKITFHVMGEPTYHPDFFEILAHAQTEKIAVGLTTNGSTLGGKTGRRLLEYNLHQIDISLQTPNKSSFELRNAGSLSFEAYLDGILNFFSSYKKRWGDTIFKFRFLNTRFPEKSLEKRVGPVRVISSKGELHETFRFWAARIYDLLEVEGEKSARAIEKINTLVPYKWNVVEIFPNIFFETYILKDWGHAFDDKPIHDAWAGYCFGMRDHFAILYNGDVTLCCIDFDGHTAMGNLHDSTLEELLSQDELGKIIEGFKKYRVIHPYCKRCLGSSSRPGWLFKPVLSVLGLKVFKPFFYKQTKIY